MNTERIDELIATYRNGLLEDTIPFWLKHGLDREQGGIMAALGRDGSILDTDKGMWQQGRFAWTMANLYNTVEQRSEWLEAAKLTVDFILAHGYDHDGRMFFHVTREGRPIRKRRAAFSDSFAATALGACAQATGESHYADRAVESFNMFVGHMTTPGAVPAKFTDERPMKSIAVPMITLVTAQCLRDSIDMDGAAGWIDGAIEEIRSDFMKPDEQAVLENVGPNGEIYDHFDGRIMTPGHAIEAAWFVLHEAKQRGNDSELIETGTTILDWMWARGWDEEYGGILYFRDLNNLPVQECWHDMKFWWPQNEAIIATLLAHHLTGDEKYAEWHRMIHDWAYSHFPDPEYGEWYGYLHRDGRVSVPLKGNLWKGPFHMPRMQWYCWKLLEEMRGDAGG
ncbi:MAG: AGE family epimerase/isomerase [Kiritimatiellia bacterium]|jgi:N-acylglucosamine 2-epimerase|nr:AGE family epimerase/isomerase [Kiritimatiellia bacterium]